MLSKKAFRTAQLARVQGAKAQTEKEAAGLIAQLIATPAWQHAHTIATTVSGPGEVPTEGVIAAAQAAGKAVLLPKTMPHRQLAFLPDPGPSGRITSDFGIPEPPYDEAAVIAQPELIIVPGLAFAHGGHWRVGFGGGYYDRFLAQATGTTIALVPQVMAFASPTWPVESFDIAIRQLIFAKA